MRTLLLGFSLLGLALAAPAQSSYFFGDNNPATGGGNVIPFGNGTTGTWQNQRAQFLVSPQFLPAMPRPLTAIGFTSTGGGNYLFQGVQIQLGHNTAGVLGSLLMGNFVTPPITVFNRANFSWNVTVNTWCRIPLDRPFIYNGKDHLVVDVTVHGSHLNPKSSFRTAGQPRTYNTNYTIQGGLSLFLGLIQSFLSRLLAAQNAGHSILPGLLELCAGRVGRDGEGVFLDGQDDLDAIVEGFVAAGLDDLAEDDLVCRAVGGVDAGVDRAGFGAQFGAGGRRGDPGFDRGHGLHEGAGSLRIG